VSSPDRRFPQTRSPISAKWSHIWALVDGVKRKAGDKVVVPVSLADAFGKGRTVTPEERADIVARKEAEAAKKAKDEEAAAKAALKELRGEAKAEKAEEKKA
jgi:hypothetical protein